MKSKLLLISAISPTPQNSGGATRIKNTVEQLSKQFQIDFVSFSKDEFPLQTNNLSDFFRYGIPYWFSPWYSHKLIKHVKNLIQNNHYDFIQIEFSQLLYLAKYLPKNIPKIFVSHDIASVSFYRRIFEDKPSLFKIIKRYFLYFQIYFYEKKYLPLFDHIITVSKTDQLTLRKLFPRKDILCIPNGIEKIDFIKKTNSKYLNLGYIGSFSHTPNLNAFKYFFNEIAPILESEKIHYKFYLAGENDLNLVNKITKSSAFINLGRVQNTRDFYKNIDCLITPIFSGSGSRIKILEALSFGIPVISSPIGAEGLNISSSYLQIANSPLEYVLCIKNLYKNLDPKDLKSQLEPLLWENVFKEYSNPISR